MFLGVWKKLQVIFSIALLTTLFLNLALLISFRLGSDNFLAHFTFTFSLFLTLQGLFTLLWMLYYWEHPYLAKKHSSPDSFSPAQMGFTALLPARHEQHVIQDTIAALANLNYPEHLKELIVLCKEDDSETIAAASDQIRKLNRPNIRLLIFSHGPTNKPHALNIGLSHASHNYVCIFDAEDQPHEDIYNVVNTALAEKPVDIVQSGVQLTTYNSNWFSLFNCLEYFFWFKSGLPFFHRLGKVAPLGGNTVFFKKEKLIQIQGWDEDCLTEDADVAFRLLAKGATMRLLYDEKYATREETPDSVSSLIKQRTRWNHGFLQILAKGSWAHLPGTRGRLVGLYILLSPFITLLTLLYMPLGLYSGIFGHESIIVSLFSFLPFYIFAAQVITHLFGVYEFSHNYKLRIPFYYYPALLLFYLPYQWVIAASSARAIWHFFKGSLAWEKTLHMNSHRDLVTNPA